MIGDLNAWTLKLIFRTNTRDVFKGVLYFVSCAQQIELKGTWITLSDLNLSICYLARKKLIDWSSSAQSHDKTEIFLEQPNLINV